VQYRNIGVYKAQCSAVQYRCAVQGFLGLQSAVQRSAVQGQRAQEEREREMRREEKREGRREEMGEIEDL